MTNTDTHPLLSANNTEQSIQSVDSTDTSECANTICVWTIWVCLNSVLNRFLPKMFIFPNGPVHHPQGIRLR